MFLSVDHSFFLFIFNPQAKSVHEGNYSCSLPGYMSAHVRIHMIVGKGRISHEKYYIFINIKKKVPTFFGTKIITET